jgi:hypothetical protein
MVGTERFRHDCAVPGDRPELIRAYWRHHRLARGDRPDRLAADELLWALEAVDIAVRDADDDLLDLLDGLLRDPGADTAYFAAGPLEDLLVEHPERYSMAVAERCRRDPLWREALQGVWLREQDRRRLGALQALLPPAIDRD